MAASSETPTKKRAPRKRSTALVEGVLAAAPVKAKLHKSTPAEYRKILQLNDEGELLALLENCQSYSRYVVILLRLAQLRDSHAVYGILGSVAYKNAQAAVETAQAKVDELEAELERRQSKDNADAIAEQVDRDRAAIEASILGWEWQYQLALDEFERTAEYLALKGQLEREQRVGQREVQTKSKKQVDLDKAIKKAIILHGPTHAKTLALREEKKQLEAAEAKASAKPAPAGDAAKEVEKLRQKLLGREKKLPSGERIFTGGQLDLEPLYTARRDEVQVQVEMQLMERKVEKLHDRHSDLRHEIDVAKVALVEAGQDLAVHNAALERAKRKAQAAREKVVEFEGQEIGAAFEHSLIERGGQFRAIFVENSLLKDNLLYAGYRQSNQAVTAQTVSIEALTPPASVLSAGEEISDADKIKWEQEISFAFSQPVIVSARMKAADFEAHLLQYCPTIKAQLDYDDWTALVNWCYDNASQAKSGTVFVKGMQRWHLFADVEDGDAEKQIVKALEKAGATVTDNELDVPQYTSWASIKPGKRLTFSIDGGFVHYVPHHSLSSKKSLPHEAPYSERGVLRVDGLAPAEAVETLNKLGIVDALTPMVPYNLIYRGTHRFGRVLPQYEPLASGRSALKFPASAMVIHGLTGIGQGGAVKRLEQIIETGGLKSIAERRRMNISVQSMSPLGDIASGIDMGVPTKIGKTTTYGGTIFFCMKPEILNRRDLWFSNKDFGGGHNRFGEYEAYAVKIGQGSIYTPPSVEARQKHLNSGLGSTNEAYFKHEISWNEVDTLFVAASLYDEVAKKAAKWRQTGLLPESVRIESFGEQQIAAAEQVSVGDWEIDDDGELVFSLGSAIERPKKLYGTDINSKIQRRADEIARTVE